MIDHTAPENPHDILQQLEAYMTRVGLKGRIAENSPQWIEMRRIFVGAWGQCLMYMRDDVTEYDDDKAMEILEDQTNQVARFFLSEQNRNN